jgi:hypothetical protein
MFVLRAGHVSELCCFVAFSEGLHYRGPAVLPKSTRALAVTLHLALEVAFECCARTRIASLHLSSCFF